MNLTSETVHLIGGLALIALLLVALWHLARNSESRMPELLIAGFFLIYGLESFFDTAVHGDAVPENYRMETMQHLIQGGIIAVAAAIELLRIAGKLNSPIWRLVMPVGLAGLGIIFLIHAQSGMDPMAMMFMTLQHRAFGIALVVAAAARILADTLFQRQRFAALGWMSSLFVFGLLLTAYTENFEMVGMMQ